jgi:UDP:flavonoid glycosyltransferase YjiC (YdhE family)
MARVAFAWELGGAFGHAMGCASLAQPLHGLGHGIAFMFRELAQLAYLPEADAYSLFQAPRYRDEGEAAMMPANYSEILLGTGYRNADTLTALVAGWRSLLSHWQADLLVADSAPTALLAARTLHLRRATYGNGFAIPPLLDPLPSFRFDEPVEASRLVDADRRALASINTALENFGAAPLARVADLFESDEQLLCTFPQLDHYATRAASGYWGPRFRFEHGTHRDWPEGSGKRVFVYLTDTCAQLDALIACLAASSHRVIAYIPQMDAARRDRLAGRGRVVLDRPARLDRLLQQCDLMITHGGDLAAGGLTRGVAQLCLPIHYEHYVTARRIEQLGAGGWLPLHAGPSQIAEAMARLLAAPRFALAARTFSQSHAAFSPAEQRRRIVARLDPLLSPKGPPSHEPRGPREESHP